MDNPLILFAHLKEGELFFNHSGEVLMKIATGYNPKGIEINCIDRLSKSHFMNPLVQVEHIVQKKD